MRKSYQIADQTVMIQSLHSEIHRLCQAYCTEERPEYVIEITQADIDFERIGSAGIDQAKGRPIQDYPDSYLETLAVYRKIAEKMPAYDTFLFHGSAIAVDGAAYIFTAKSGTGKSTHARLWRETLGERAVMVNDDKPLIRVHPEGTATVYGTPWDGKHHLSSNIAVPVRAICILERAAENHIREIMPSEALPMLLQQVYRPMNATAMAQTLHLIDRLAGRVKLYRLGCNMEIRAAELSYNTMKG